MTYFMHPIETDAEEVFLSVGKQHSCLWVYFHRPSATQTNPPNKWPNPTHCRVNLWTQYPTQPTPNWTTIKRQTRAAYGC